MNEIGESKRVVLGISGSVSAYRSAELARMLVSWGYQVRVVMTPAAKQFVAPLTFQTITGFPAVKDFWCEGAACGNIELADWAEAVAIAPASADFIAKLAAGFAENPLLAICLATRAPLLIAPAMSENMYQHPATRENVQILMQRGAYLVAPVDGDGNTGWQGNDRMADPWELFYHVRRVVSQRDYEGKRVLITTGPTQEALDGVTYLSTRASGKMGVALAREAFRRGADVTLIHGPIEARVPRPVHCTEISSAHELHALVMQNTFEHDSLPDVVIMAAAVSNFRPKADAIEKLKRGKGALSLDLVENPDILAELGAKRGDEKRPILVGFSIETGEIDELLAKAREKIERKRVDMLVGHYAEDAYDLDANRAWLVDKGGKVEEVATSYKSRVANKILDRILKL